MFRSNISTQISPRRTHWGRITSAIVITVGALSCLRPNASAAKVSPVKVLDKPCPYIDAARVNALLGTQGLLGKNKMTSEMTIDGVKEFGCGFTDAKLTQIVSIIRTDRPLRGAIDAARAADPQEAKFNKTVKGLGTRSSVVGYGGVATLTMESSSRYLVVGVVTVGKYPNSPEANPTLVARVTELAKVLIA